MRFPRSAGILLHPTSLPGRYGIGDLGSEAMRWVDTLAQAGQTIWQVLPLGPTGFGDSPYQCFSAMAGNDYLVSPDLLVEDGLLQSADLDDTPRFPDDVVDFGPVIDFKARLLERSYERFRVGSVTGDGGRAAALRDAFGRFCHEHAAWIDDYALFMALKTTHSGRPWPEWNRPLARRDPAALAEARRSLEPAVESHRFRQFVFFRQWGALRDRARQRGVRLIGDVPIFVAHDCADVWAHPDRFELDENGYPTAVAGVPPDYFTKTGQLWGNPLYRWDVHERTGQAWWVQRILATLELVDIVRLDHFRGFEAYWEVPAGHSTAEHGRWKPGPGRRFFETIRAALGDLPMIAEDLGHITPEVLELRDALGLPGMRILQFAFGSDANSPFLPHNFTPDCVVYTGTHDNDPTRSWFNQAPERERVRAMRYLSCNERDLPWALIRAAYASVAHTAVIPLQDILELGREGRMNIPGRPAGNWGWRFRWEAIEPWRWERLAEFAELYGRTPAQQRIEEASSSPRARSADDS